MFGTVVGPDGVGAAVSNGERGYAELHCHTNFSFLDGASHPEELADEAARLGLAALAVTDHDGLYGVVRFALAARAAGLPTVFGAELTLDALRTPPNGYADPPGEHLVVLAEGPVGYARLARAVSAGAAGGGEGRAPPRSRRSRRRRPRRSICAAPRRAPNDAWFVLTGCRKGAVPRALLDDGPAAARRALDRLVAAFGRDRVLVELWDHGDPLDRHRNDALAEVAASASASTWSPPTTCTTPRPAQRPLATALAAVRARRSLDEIDGWLPAAPFAHLRSAAEQQRRFARWPGAVERTRRDRGGVRVRPRASPRPTCPTTTCRRVTPR